MEQEMYNISLDKFVDIEIYPDRIERDFLESQELKEWKIMKKY